MLLDQQIGELEGALMGVMPRDDRGIASAELDVLSHAGEEVYNQKWTSCSLRSLWGNGSG